MLQVNYISASLKVWPQENQTLRHINCDVVLVGSTHKNQLVFKSNRKHNNVWRNLENHKIDQTSWRYYEVFELTKQIQNDLNYDVFLGLGFDRLTYSPGQRQSAQLNQNTACVFWSNPNEPNQYWCKIFIEDFESPDIQFSPTSIARFPFKGEYRTESYTTSYRRQWR